MTNAQYRHGLPTHGIDCVDRALELVTLSRADWIDATNDDGDPILERRDDVRCCECDIEIPKGTLVYTVTDQGAFIGYVCIREECAGLPDVEPDAPPPLGAAMVRNADNLIQFPTPQTRDELLADHATIAEILSPPDDENDDEPRTAGASDGPGDVFTCAWCGESAPGGPHYGQIEPCDKAPRDKDVNPGFGVISVLPGFEMGQQGRFSV